jgi:hypothetical protein
MQVGRLITLTYFLYLVGFVDAFGSGLTLKIEAHAEHCVFDDVKTAGDRVFFSFQVTAGGSLDIDVAIHGPEMGDIWTTERESESRVLFKAPVTGTYQFCFSNKMSTLTGKTVQFHISVGDPIEAMSKNKNKDRKRPDSIERSIVRLEEGLMEIRDEQQYLRTRERIHRDTAESTNARVMYWSIFESGLLVLMGLGQVFYLKRCFEVTRNV